MFVSIIIPVRNSASQLSNCLRQLVQQDYPHAKMEVIIADGASTDETEALIKGFELEGIAKQFLRLSATGRSAGLNAAIRAAKGDVICRLDARSRIPNNYIRLCVETLISTGAVNVGGLQVPCGVTPKQMAIGWAMSHPFGAGNAKFKTAKVSGYVDSVYLGFFRRSVFDTVGYYDDSGMLISEDSDLNERIRAKGYNIYLNVSINVGYEPRVSLRDHSRLYLRYGMARVGNMRKNGRLTSWRQLPAPGLVGALALLPFFGLIHPVFWLLLGAIFCIYLCFDAIFSTQIAWREKSVCSIPVLMAAFPVMHFSWGIGFWRALLCGSQNDESVVV